jgi:hypothetical protein
MVVLVGCGRDGPGSPDPGAEVDAGDGAVDAMPDADPEPAPAFTVAAWLTGSLAIDDEGIRDTFRIGSDAHILAGLAAIEQIEVGFARARFAEDRPYLDVFLDGDAWLPSGTASIVRTRGGLGSAMSVDGVVDESVRVEPDPGTLDRALYDF